ncbi:hypothetical protein L484_009171 [Morus notabilis]|uniref:Uncharacterized protein n=1 Tax=Morus notabilis TaxID=981085 RepID=W9RHX2_9ROSA|nr:hypothetical protein L484_009171 [Morus notabilis]
MSLSITKAVLYEFGPNDDCTAMSSKRIDCLQLSLVFFTSENRSVTCRSCGPEPTEIFPFLLE